MTPPSSDDEWIPLLSGRPLSDFTPESFREYVRGLKTERKAKKKAPNRKPYKLTARILKSGTISLRTARKPPYVTEEELLSLEETLKRPANEIFLAIREAGFITVGSHREAQEIRKAQEEIPWT